LIHFLILLGTFVLVFCCRL